VLGALEYVNRDGGWWQGQAQLASSVVRVDLQQRASVPEQALTVAANFLEWVQKNEAIVRSHVEKVLSAGDARSNMLKHVRRVPRLADPRILRDLRPYMIVLWDDRAELRYDCDALPEANLFGAQQVFVDIDSSNSPESVFLMDLGFDRRAERLFDRPVPPDAADYANSLGDQLIAKAATGMLELDAELRGYLAQAIADANQRISTGTVEVASYMTSVRALLLELGKSAPTVVKLILVDLRCQHPSGKLTPFKQKLILAPEDGVVFERSGSMAKVRMLSEQRIIGGARRLPGVLFPEDYESFECFAAALADQLKNAAKWFAKQSASAFRELREAGYVMDIDVDILARLGHDPVKLELPADFLSECGRLGLKVSITTNNSVPE
jgi:hypothetical protein